MSIDEFKANMAKAINSAIELRIVTHVGATSVSGVLGQSSDPTKKPLEIEFPTLAQSNDTIVTSINLVQGDITNVVPTRFWAPEQKNILDFHEAQVKEAKEIVARNLGVLAQLGKQLLDLAKG